MDDPRGPRADRAADVAVIGGGPAGATAAAFLARAGCAVILCEQKKFPRNKVCGEFISPLARPVFDALGLLNAFDRAAGPIVSTLAAYPAEGPSLHCAMPADPMHGLARSLARDQLDAMLVDRARQLGVDVWQPCHVAQVEGSAARGFTVHTACGDIAARAVVLAHGLAQRGSMSAAVEPHPTDGGFMCFKAHIAGADLPADTIAIGGSERLYAGLVETSRGADTAPRYSLAFVVGRERLARRGAPADVHLTDLLRQNAGFRRLLARARRLGPWHACGPLRPGVRQVYADGRFFAGNAAGEVHALVGEGITLAMRAGQLLGEIVGTLGLADLDAAGARYEAAWRAEFTHRYRAANVFANLVMHPPAAALAAATLDWYPEILRYCVAASGKIGRG